MERKASANDLNYYLSRQGVGCSCIHGDRTQAERERALNDFKRQNIRILIATDVAARGLDIPNVAYVIIFDLPSNIESYVHKIGRTGRIGNTGMAITLVDEKPNAIHRDLLNLLQESNQEIPDWFKSLVNGDNNISQEFYSTGNSRGNKSSSYGNYDSREDHSYSNRGDNARGNSSYGYRQRGGRGNYNSRNEAENYSNEDSWADPYSSNQNYGYSRGDNRGFANRREEFRGNYESRGSYEPRSNYEPRGNYENRGNYEARGYDSRGYGNEGNFNNSGYNNRRGGEYSNRRSDGYRNNRGRGYRDSFSGNSEYSGGYQNNPGYSKPYAQSNSAYPPNNAYSSYSENSYQAGNSRYEAPGGYGSSNTDYQLPPPIVSQELSYDNPPPVSGYSVPAVNSNDKPQEDEDPWGEV